MLQRASCCVMYCSSMVGMAGEKLYDPKRRSAAAAAIIRNRTAIDEEDQTPLSSDTPPTSSIIVTCPCCSLQIKINNHQVFPAGTKFEPTDQELLQHLEAKVQHKPHSLIDEFIPTVDEEEIQYLTNPEILKNGKMRHFFHRSSKPYSTSDRKRRKICKTDENQWHEIGETTTIFIGGEVKGFKKMLVLDSNYGDQSGVEETNWVRYQYHLVGNSSEEEDGKWVISKVFYVQLA